jgi:hypothetical protein
MHTEAHAWSGNSPWSVPLGMLPGQFLGAWLFDDPLALIDLFSVRGQ